MGIVLNEKSFAAYGETIYKHENVIISKVNGKFLVNRKEAHSYIFKNDYYFLMGDNRMNSWDSRFFGPIPFNGVIGKVESIF